MKTNLFHRIGIAITLCFSTIGFAQTAGTLDFSFNQPVPTTPSLNKGTVCVLAVWIENNAGKFIKTKMRYVSGSTDDHLPVFAVKAGGLANNALNNVNVTDATTGATLKAGTNPTHYGTRTFTWDGKDVNGASNGTTVPDGVYKVWIESSWNDAKAGIHNQIASFSFTKGPTSATTTDIGDNYVNTIVMKWKATGLSVDENVAPNTQVVVYPNPTTGILNIEFKNEINNIKILNMLGQVVYEKTDVSNPGTNKSIDLSSNGSGMYLINVSNDKGTSSYKVLLEK